MKFLIKEKDLMEVNMTVVEEKIDSFLRGLEKALNTDNYYAALCIGFTLPDICSKLEKPNLRTGQRYPQWYEEFMQSKYETYYELKNLHHTFLNGNDFYALRCAFLHQGEVDITNQRARKALTDFKFVASKGSSHCNQCGTTLQLDVQTFCGDILKGTVAWLIKYRNDSEINFRAENLIEISYSHYPNF